MVAMSKFHSFTKDLVDGEIDFDGHVFKIALTNTAPTAASDDQLADITQIPNGNGYTTGGAATTVTTSTASGVAKVSCSDVVWTASAGSMGTFRYLVLYDDTATGDPLVGYWDYGSAVTLPDGSSFTFDFGAAGAFTVT